MKTHLEEGKERELCCCSGGERREKELGEKEMLTPWDTGRGWKKIEMRMVQHNSGLPGGVQGKKNLGNPALAVPESGGEKRNWNRGALATERTARWRTLSQS